MDQIEVREKLEQMQNQFELNCDLYKQCVKTMKVIFDMLVEEGFTEQQALEIVKARGINLA